MRYGPAAVAFAISASFAASAASAQTCGAGRATCYEACTPDRIAVYHAGSERRCTASCEPRYRQCVTRGEWADIENRRSGWYEPVSRW